MSKCREELDKWFNANAYGSQKLAARIWQAAWNARGKVDAEICEKEMQLVLADAIEQEDEK